MNTAAAQTAPFEVARSAEGVISLRSLTIIVTGVAVLAPLALILYQSVLSAPFFDARKVFGFEAYEFIFADPDFWSAFLNSALIAAGMTLIAVPLGALLAFSVMGIYVYVGGLRGIGWVAVLKGIFMAAVGVYVVFRVVRHFYGGINALFTQLSQYSPAHLMLPGPPGSWLLPGSIAVSLANWLPGGTNPGLAAISLKR